MNRKEEYYKKLIRIRYHNKVFDIFSGENHQKTFLEVRLENGKEEYYYPILKDYIGLNNIYNKSFDGKVHSKKYSFKSKVIFASYLAGISIVITSCATKEEVEYQLQPQPLVAELITSSTEAQKDFNRLSEALETIAQGVAEVKIDPTFYYQDGSEIMIYNNDALTAFGMEDVTFEDVRNTLAQNEKISDKYRLYMEEYLDRLEERMPQVDLRVLNNNWKILEYEEDLDNDGLDDGYFDIEDGKIHLKEEYINQETGKPDEKKLKEKVWHELTHTLNYGKIIIEDKDTSKELTLYKFFRRSNYGESFSEGFTTILTDYLLADDVETYFENENPKFGSYQITTPYCYQILKGMDNYDFYDFINKDVLYFDQKVKEYGLEDAISVLDAYFKSLDMEIEILEMEELKELTESIFKNRIEQEINKGSSNFKILTNLSEFPLELENQFDILQEMLSTREDGMIHLLTEEEKSTGLSEEELLLRGSATVKIYRDGEQELLEVSPRMLAIYRSSSPEAKYRLVYLGKDQEYHDCQTDEIVEFNLENQLELIQVLPQIDMTIQLSLLNNPDFVKVVDEKFEQQDQVFQQQKEELARMQAEKENLKMQLEPLIVSALDEGKGDLEICRIISENTENIDMAMTILGEYKENILIQYKSPFIYTEEMPNTMISMIDTNGQRVSDQINDSYVIYKIENESGISYRLGKIEEVDGQQTIYDYLGKQMVEPGGTVLNLKDILPEVEQYGVIIKEEFFSSPEFINLMNQKLAERQEVIEEEAGFMK